MTAKELLLVLAGTAVAAGGAGVVAALVARGGPDESTDRADRVLARLDELSWSIDATHATLDENRTAIDALGNRISEVELRTVGRPGRVDARPARAAADDGAAAAEGATEEIGAAVTRNLGEWLNSSGGPAQTLQLGQGAKLKLMDGAVTELSSTLQGLTAGLALRKLPEEERWEKAREELGLTQNQIDEIRAATDARDEALEASMSVTHSEDGGGGRYTIKNVDPSKAKEANDAYRRRVENSLNEDQRTAWREKGYDRAFGKRGMGGFSVSSGVITISTSIDRKDGTDPAEK